ncbi:MAG: hypothetical protein IK016_05495 [Lachnospiraceae bacterium]|nr:hypothetical protein [Lachnospiraceae bacterium]
MRKKNICRFHRLIALCCMAVVLASCGNNAAQKESSTSTQSASASQDDTGNAAEETASEPEETAPVLQEFEGTLVAELPDYGRFYLQSVTLEKDITQLGKIYQDDYERHVEAQPCIRLQGTLVNDVRGDGECRVELVKNTFSFDTERQRVIECFYAWGWDDGSYQRDMFTTYKTKIQAGPVESDVTGPVMGESKTLSILLYDAGTWLPGSGWNPFANDAYEFTEQSIIRVNFLGNTFRIRLRGGGAFDCETAGELMEVDDLQKVVDEYNTWKGTDYQAGVDPEPWIPENNKTFRYTDEGELKSVMFNWNTSQDTGDAPHQEALQHLQTMIPLLINDGTKADTVLSFLEQCIKEKSVNYPGAETDFLYVDGYYITWHSEYSYGSSEKAVTHKFSIDPFPISEEERAGIQ